MRKRKTLTHTKLGPNGCGRGAGEGIVVACNALAPIRRSQFGLQAASLMPALGPELERPCIRRYSTSPRHLAP
jgi:hypothetical protein